MAEPRERDMILLLADISGYTRYMQENRTAAVHSQGIITELLEAVMREADLPLQIAKLEGDAVFMFAERADTLDWAAVGRAIGDRLGAFVNSFDAKLADLLGTLVCPCSACRNLDKLRLKVVAHAGQAVRHRLGRFEELTGVDVILVHRLLKNEVAGNSYLLLTEPAFMALAPPLAAEYRAHALQDRDLGAIPFRVRMLGSAPGPTHPAQGARAWCKTMLREVKWGLQAWRAPKG